MFFGRFESFPYGLHVQFVGFSSGLCFLLERVQHVEGIFELDCVDSSLGIVIELT